MAEQAQAAMDALSTTTATPFGIFSIGTVIIALAIGAGIAFLIAMVLYQYIKSGLRMEKSAILAETKVPQLGNTLTKASGGPIPALQNGLRMAFTFWIYIHNPDAFKGVYRHVWHRGMQNPSVACSPLVYLDANTTRLIVRFMNTADAQQPPIEMINQPFIVPPGTATTNTPEQNQDIDLATHGISIDYIPIQRWVHVAIVVNEEVNGGTIYAYLDGELVKRVTSVDTPTTLTHTPINLQNLVLDQPGDVWIGGNMSDPNIGPGFSGLVGKITFFNYDINLTDIYNDYKSGPIDNIMAKMGLPPYGVRSPIYRLNG